jgi:hypothetical protein
LNAGFAILLIGRDVLECLKAANALGHSTALSRARTKVIE